MDELTEDRVREIVKEALSKVMPVRFTLEIDGKEVAKSLVKFMGKSLSGDVE